MNTGFQISYDKISLKPRSQMGQTLCNCSQAAGEDITQLQPRYLGHMDPPHSTDRGVGTDTSTEQTDVRDKGKEPVVPQHLHRDVGHLTGATVVDNNGKLASADMGPRSSPTVLPTAMSATRSMQTLSIAPARVDLPTGGDAHEDTPEASTVDNISSFPGSSRIASTGTLQATLVVSDEELIPLKIQKVLGNDIFYKNLNDISLQIFGPTIRKRWNDQEKKLKDELTNHMERIERKKGNTPPDTRRRLSDTSKATKARQEKHGQHKLGSGGYMKLTTQIGSEFNRAPTEDDKRIGYQQGYIAVAERLLELSGQTQDSDASVTTHDNRGTEPVHEGPDVHPSSGEHVVGGDQVEHDPGRQHQKRDVPQSEDLEGAQHVKVEGRENDVEDDVEDDVAPSGKECNGYVL
ncbi:hypothetical protein SUGI_1151440 [Cryptomeria japonica]|nr:hypothetical protein SUGI_1151440 [Cryptomeria japonica]